MSDFKLTARLRSISLFLQCEDIIEKSCVALWSGTKAPVSVCVCMCVLPGLNLQDIILIVLSVSVVVVTAIALIFYR